MTKKKTTVLCSAVLRSVICLTQQEITPMRMRSSNSPVPPARVSEMEFRDRTPCRKVYLLFEAGFRFCLLLPLERAPVHTSQDARKIIGCGSHPDMAPRQKAYPRSWP